MIAIRPAPQRRESEVDLGVGGYEDSHAGHNDSSTRTASDLDYSTGWQATSGQGSRAIPPRDPAARGAHDDGRIQDVSPGLVNNGVWSLSLIPAFFYSVNGTLLNALTVLIGGTLGALAGGRLPERIHDALFGVLGLFTILIGLADGLTAKNSLIVLGSLLIGVLVGEALNIERALQALGDWAERRLARPGSTVSEAFVTASLVFCVGPLSILGSLDNGLSGDTTKLVIKATLDGFAALAIGATLGWGVLLSVVTILAYQGAVSLAAHSIAPLLNANPTTVTELTATGGVILVAIGLKLLKIRDLRVANWLPALVAAPLIVALIAYVPRLPF